ncbi:MAG TPA: iron ABC transporter permease [Chloroflexota bacterium]|jgi:iron(III) transport system permease protein
MQATLRLPLEVKRPRRRRVRNPGLLLVALLPMAVIAVLVAVLIFISFQAGLAGSDAQASTLANYAELLSDSLFYTALRNTAVFAVVSILVALLAGLPIAWLAERTTIHGKALVYATMTVGIVIPGIYTAMGWTFIGNPRIGIINKLLQGWFGLDSPPLNIGTPIGMGFVQGLSLAPLGFILSAQMFRAMNPSLEEAARVHGMSFKRTLRKVTLPLARPGILAAVIYIATIALATFDIPAILGLGNREYMLSTYVYDLVHPPGAGEPNYGVAAALGTFMILIALALTMWYATVLRSGERYQVVTGKGYRPVLLNVGPWEFAAWGFIVAYALLTVLVPLAVLGFVAFTPYVMAPSLAALGKMGWANYRGLDWELIVRGLQHTLTLMAVVPVVVVLLSFAVSWLVVRSRIRARYALDFGAFLPQAIPELVLAVSALLLALFVVGKLVPLYGSVWLIAIVYIVARLAFATRAFNGALLQIHRELEEAAISAGLTMARTSRKVLIPLLRPTLFSVWLWTALLVYRELTAAVFLSSERNITLQAVVWSFWFSGAQNKAAAITLLVTVVMAPLIALFWWFGRRGSILGNA